VDQQNPVTVDEQRARREPWSCEPRCRIFHKATSSAFTRLASLSSSILGFPAVPRIKLMTTFLLR
jgi:hypothetical protein